MLIKKSFVAVCLLANFFSYSQIDKKINDDSLKKYSYFIGVETIEPISEGLITVSVGNGTAFFIRQPKGLYLITARHTLTPCINGKKLFLNKLFVWLQNKDGQITEKIDIEPIQFIDLMCRDQKSDTDAIAIKINRPLEVFSVESFIAEIPIEYNEVEMWGYPENKKDTSKRTDYQLISKTILPPGSFSHNTIQDTATNNIDLVNSYLLSKTSINTSGRSGYSGSPTFMKDKKTGQWVFIGLNWGHGEFSKEEKYFELVRPNILLKQIESLDETFSIK